MLWHQAIVAGTADANLSCYLLSGVVRGASLKELGKTQPDFDFAQSSVSDFDKQVLPLEEWHVVTG